MVETLQDFASLLRRAGLRLSSDELLEGLRGVELVGLAEPAVLKQTLAATWVKRSEDKERFEALFDLFFRGGKALAEATESASLLRFFEGLELDDAKKAALLRLLARQVAELTAAGKIALGVDAPEIASLVKAAGMASELEGIRTPLQVGFYSYRLLGKLGFDQGEVEARRVVDALAASLDADQREQLSGLVSDNVRSFKAAVRAHVEGQFALQQPNFRAQLGRETLRDRAFVQLSRSDMAAMRAEIRRLAHLLKARMSMRRRAQPRGRLDVRRSLRASLATGGVPFALRFRRRPPRKPRLVVLCDVSDSVGNVSRFMLQFGYLLQELFSGVYSFAFVAELAELTELFRDNDIEAAIEMALDGSAVNVFSNSNYGQALSEFHARHLGLLNRRTTLLIIGDGRNNYHASEAHLLDDMRRRCRQLIWLNPEAPAAWGFGDSAMKDYEVHCDKVVVAYSLRSLETVVSDLLDAEVGR